MVRSFIAVVVSLLLIAPAPLFSKGDAPDLTKILRVIGRHGMGHACPIAPRIAITAAHVVDVRPFENVPLFGGRFEQIAGLAGIFEAASVSQASDLAVLSVNQDVRWYPIAREAPKAGDTLWWVGYDWSNQKDAMRPVHFEQTVTRVIAGHIVFDKATLQGSSGSCVVNAVGEVVGVIAFGMKVGEPMPLGNGLFKQDEICVAVGVWGDWLPPVAELEKAVAEPAVTIINIPAPAEEPKP